MRRRVKLVLALAVIVPIALVTSLEVEPASAVTPPVNATGTVSCTSAAGVLKFVPPLTTTGTAIETTTVKVALAGCNAIGSNVTSAAFTGKGNGAFVWSTNNCDDLTGTNSVIGALAIKWSAKSGTAKVNPTMVTLTTVTGLGSGQNGNVGISFANQPASGSFPSPVQAELDSNESAQTASGPTGCGARSGLKKLAIVVGDLTSYMPTSHTVTFNYNGTNGTDGSAQTWTVPPGVTSITVEATGAEGGGEASSGVTPANGGLGGTGSVTVSVVPGVASSPRCK